MAEKPKNIYLAIRVDCVGRVELYRITRPFPSWVREYIKGKVYTTTDGHHKPPHEGRNPVLRRK